MHPSLLLATIQAAALTVAPGPPDGCPTSTQVAAALAARASSLLGQRPEDDPGKVLTLTLMPASSNGETSFSLTDGAGLVKLYRSLPGPNGDRARDCVALADTVAFIVIRYFEEVELPPLPETKPPPTSEPPPPAKAPAKELAPADAAKVDLPKLSLSANGGRRYPGAAVDFGGFEAKLGLGVMLATFAGRNFDLWLDVSAGFAGHGTVTVVRGPVATDNRWSGELALLAGRRSGRSRFYAGPAANLDLIWIDTESQTHTQHEQRFAAAAGIKIGYQHFWASRFFARVDWTTDVALMKEKVVVASSQTVMLYTPRVYVTLALGLGVWF